MSPLSRVASRTRRRAAASLAATAAVGASLAGPGTVPSVAAAVDCPAPFPVAELSAGQAVTGLTTSSGTRPDGFTGEVLGVLDDGIITGLDLVLVRLASPEIDRVGGIWAGMSGSPVYAADGRLIGAVSYTLALGPSPVAGVTPAAEMDKLVASTLGGAAAPTPGQTTGQTTGRTTGQTTAARVDLPRALQRELVAAGDASVAGADAGLRQLKIPFGVSGGNHVRLRQVKRKLGLDNVRLYRASASGAAAAAATDIVPGGNLAVSVSYGDVTAAGVGTVTAVCGNDVIGFGHPMLFNGTSTLTMHGADAIYVQEDPTLGGYKLANPSAPVGIINQDRLAGIGGVVGTIPEATTVTSTVTSEETDETRTGVSHVSVPEYLPFSTFYAAFLNTVRVFDAQAPGSAQVHYTISGTTDDGEPFSLERSNRFASDHDITWRPADEVATDVYRLLGNDFADLTFDDVTVDTTVSPQVRVFEIATVERRVAGEWRVIRNRSVLRARAGAVLHLRVTGTSFRDRYGTLTARVRTLVPENTRPGAEAYLRLSGGADYYGRSGARPTTLQELIDTLEAAPTNDSLVARLYTETRRRVSRTTTAAPADDVLRGNRSFSVRVIR